MKFAINTILLWFFAVEMIAQSDRNYIMTTIPLVEVNTVAQVDALSHQDKMQQMQYMDAFGRIEMNIQVKESPQGHNIIQGFQYDQNGRATRSYLPYCKNYNSPLNYVQNWQTDQSNFYGSGLGHVAQSDFPYSEAEYLSSPLNKIKRQSSPGEEWSLSGNHITTNLDGPNSISDEILIWKLNEDGLPVIDEIDYVDNSNFDSPFAVQNFDLLNSPDWQFNSGDLIGSTDHIFEITHPAPLAPIIFSGLNENTTYVVRVLYSSFSVSGGCPIFFALDFYNNGTPVGNSVGSPGLYVDFWFETVPITGATEFRLVKNGPGGDSGDDINIYEIQVIEYTSPLTTNYYPNGFLYKKSASDTEAAITEEYFNFQGQIILKREYKNSSSPLDTYFVYDSHGRQRYVIPPMASSIAASNVTFEYSEIADFVFEKRYDGRNRVIEDIVPGKEPVHFVYDNLNRVILEQDGNLRSVNKWNFKKYDADGHQIMAGIYVPTSLQLREELEIGYNYWWLNNPEQAFETRTNDASFFGYTNLCYPSGWGGFEVMTVSYYDNYDFTANPEFEPNEIALYEMNNKGLETGSLVKILNNGNDYLLSVKYYDDKRRLVELHKQTLNGKDVFFTGYNWIGDVLISKRTHSWDGANLTVSNRFEYDNSRRLKKCFQKTGLDNEITLYALDYNELGQIVKKKLHRDETASNYLQVVDFRYNIRGWLLKINNADLVDDSDNLEDDDVFGEELLYAQDLMTSLDYTPQFGGNVAAMKWKTKSPEISGTSLESKLYTFHYDQANRLIEAQSATNTLGYPTNFNGNLNLYNESLQYDHNGNILSLQRFNDGQGVDNLIYNYETGSNRINYIHEQWGWPIQGSYKHFPFGTVLVDEYNYDSNGNMTWDANKGIRLEYNELDLVQVAHKQGNQDVIYTYDATGNKLKKEIEGNVRYYVNGIEYSGNIIKQIAHEEGVVRLTPSDAENLTSFVYDYHIKDHLGNVRVIITNENAVHENYHLTHELEKRLTEEAQFENVPPVRDNKPLLMPDDTSYGPNLKVSDLSSSNGQSMGPAKVIAVRQGDILDFSTQYWYEDFETNTTSQTISEIFATLISGLLVQGTGIIPAGEFGLGMFSNSISPVSQALNQFVTESFGSEDLAKPQAYLVYITLNAQLKVDPLTSGALRVDAASILDVLEVFQLRPRHDGYVYMSLLNGSSSHVYYDNFKIIKQRANVLAQMDYYPFGLQWKNPDMTITGNRNWHSSKEMQDKEWSSDEGLDLEDFGARMYDPVIGRWWSVDPMADQHTNYSTYNFVRNNPMIFIDPTGMSEDFYQDEDGNIIWNNSRASSINVDGTNYRNIGQSIRIDAISEIKNPHSLPLPAGLSEAGAGEKLSVTTTITGNYDENGNFKNFTASIGGVDVGKSFGIIPGEEASGFSQNMTQSQDGSWLGGSNFTTRVSNLEKPFITVVDVNQNTWYYIDPSGKFYLGVSHGTFPSVGIWVNGSSAYQFQQHDYTYSHDGGGCDWCLFNVENSYIMNQQYAKTNAPYVLWNGYSAGAYFLNSYPHFPANK